MRLLSVISILLFCPSLFAGTIYLRPPKFSSVVSRNYNSWSPPQAARALLQAIDHGDLRTESYLTARLLATDPVLVLNDDGRRWIKFVGLPSKKGAPTTMLLRMDSRSVCFLNRTPLAEDCTSNLEKRTVGFRDENTRRIRSQAFRETAWRYRRQRGQSNAFMFSCQDWAPGHLTKFLERVGFIAMPR